MNDVDLALNQISNIRAQMAANSRFLGLSPEFNVLMGLLAAALTLIQAFIIPPQDNFSYIAVWSAVLVASSGIATFDAIARTRREHGRMANAFLGTLLEKIFPFWVAAAALTLVICTFSKDTIWLLPGLWQMLIGLMGFAILTGVPRAMIAVVGWYFSCSVVVLVITAQTHTLSPWVMGVPFAVGQLAAGFILANEKEKNKGGRRV